MTELAIPQSTESLTKLLRSKDITTSQIVEITSKFSEFDFFFPNKEIFILELIEDRWNDQKLVLFKQDYKLWKLYNDMFSSLTDKTIQKKLLKDLKFVPHLLKTLDLVDSSIPKFLTELKRICVLINSLIRVEVSSENAIRILGKTLSLIQQTNSSHEELVHQMIFLTDISNVVEVSTKMSTYYCNELLLPTVKYSAKFGSESKIMSDLQVKFLFDPLIDPVQLLESFVKNNHARLAPQDCTLIFEKSIHFLSKEHFAKLEKIFTIIIRVQEQLAPILLKELSISKKTMSQEFLNELFEETIKDPKYDAKFWSLIFHILDLDVEIGIQRFEQLIELIVERRDTDTTFVKNLWTKLIQCFVNAREIPALLQKMQTYFGNHQDSSMFLLEKTKYSDQISRNIIMLSIAQLKCIISDLINKILADNAANNFFALLLKLILRGLPRLSYISLPELKPVVSQVFDVNAGHPSKLWEIWYLAMEVYDDIVPLDSLASIDHQVSIFISLNEKPKELFYYFFKLREYKDFNLLPLVKEFLEFLRGLDAETKKIVLREVFTNWCSLINLIFPREALDFLTTCLVSESNVDLLNVIFEDDNVFEEPNVMYSLVQNLSESLGRKSALLEIIRIPIQCINKNTRVKLLNSLCSKEKITASDTNLVGHLLNNPTYKSSIESQVESLYLMLLHTGGQLNYENIAIERVWQNHLGQMKEKNSISFIQEGVKFISEGMDKTPDDMIYFQLAFLALKVCDTDVLNILKSNFVRNCLEKLSVSDIGNAPLLSWLLRVLYYIFKSDQSYIPQDKSILREILIIKKNMKLKSTELEKDLWASIFLLYSMVYDDKVEYLCAHYMVLRTKGIQSEKILPAIENSVKNSNFTQFNAVFSNLTFSLASCDPLFSESLLEIYRVIIESLTKDNSTGPHLFLKSICEFYTNCEHFKNAAKQVLHILQTLQVLLISKPWLFSQYCIEMLFPMCLKLVFIFTENSKPNDLIFIYTTKVISNILLAHGVKLSNRHHLMNTLLCAYIELIADYKNTGLDSQCAKSLARLIINFVEPGNNSSKFSNKKNPLSSTIGQQKKLLRKYAPMILIKYIHLSIYSPFEALSRRELAIAMYSIFDLISPAEMSMINGILDTAGRQYFRNLYADYRKVGKWDAN